MKVQICDSFGNFCFQLLSAYQYHRPSLAEWMETVVKVVLAQMHIKSPYAKTAIAALSEQV